MRTSEVSRLERRLKGKWSDSKISPMYIYASEMVSSYYSRLNLKGKAVLTISGSGDQVIDAFFSGAKRVVGFDVNAQAQHILRLKIAAINALSYKEFLMFFGTAKYDATFDRALYIKLKQSLGGRTRDFFDSLYIFYNGDGRKLAKSSFFNQRSHPTSVTSIVSYLKNEKNYLKMKKFARSVRMEFIRCNVATLASSPRMKGERFDIINLSNVPNFFVSRLKSKDRIMSFFDDVLLRLRKHLNNKGKIFYYSFSPSAYPNPMSLRVPLASSRESVNRLKTRKEFRLYELRFRGIGYVQPKKIQYGGFDRINILEKV
jgi:hypothetical protein